MKVGLTGGVASGKSLVLQIVAEMGAYTIDADKIAKALTQKDSPVLEEIEQAFGSAVFINGELNRKKLGELIFSNEEQRKKLESILHPRIIEHIREGMDRFKAKDPNVAVVVDVPLLFEVGMEEEFDLIWLVWVDHQTQLVRLCEREGITEEKAKKMLNAQMPLEKKKMRAHRLIDNTGTAEETKKQVKKLYFEIATC